MREIRIDSSVAMILPVVKGLVSEEETVREAIELSSPEAVAVSISKEELAALAVEADYEKYELSELEEAYASGLKTFGEVRVPPPCFVEARSESARRGLPIFPLDMNDEMYTEAYCANVRTLEMLGSSRMAGRMSRKSFDVSGPHEFVKDWDSKVNRKGFRKLEEAREAHMAKALRNLLTKHSTVLAIIETERADGVMAALRAAQPSRDVD